MYMDNVVFFSFCNACSKHICDTFFLSPCVARFFNLDFFILEFLSVLRQHYFTTVAANYFENSNTIPFIMMVCALSDCNAVISPPPPSFNNSSTVFSSATLYVVVNAIL